MPLAFLAPAFLLGLAALAIPVVIHLVHRERKQVVRFPSLMFLERIPYRTVRRQRIRHWALLLLRCAALVLLASAFARPFVLRPHAAAAVAGGARDMVILLDRSYSMGYQGRWDAARAAARRVLDGLGPDDRASLVLFDASARAATQPTTDRARLRAVLDSARVGSGRTRYSPALRLAAGILAPSKLPRREVVLVSDFQKLGWDPGDPVKLPTGVSLTPVDVGHAPAPDAAVTSVAFRREPVNGAERVTATARVVNRGDRPLSALDVALELGGRRTQSERVSIPAHGMASVAFEPFILPSAAETRGTVRAAADALPADDAFHFVLSPGRALPVLLLDGGADGGLYLHRALSIADPPGFRVTEEAAARFQAADLGASAVVVLNGAPFPGGEAGRRLRAWIEGGGGLVVVAGQGSRLDGLFPAVGDDDGGGAGAAAGRSTRAEANGIALGRPTDARDASGMALGRIEYTSPVFEPFAAPHAGDFSAARFFRVRPVVPGDSATVLARFEDGTVALAERKLGRGRVLVWGSSLDAFWNDLALQPVFLPFVQQLVRYAAGRTPPSPWLTVGQVADLSATGPFDAAGPIGAAGGSSASGDRDFVVLAPDGGRIRFGDGESGRALTVDEQGFYELRHGTGGEGNAPASAIAVNLDLAESDLTPLDPRELVAAVTALPGSAPVTDAQATPAERERRQNWWWYLLVGAFAVLAAESVVSNRLSRVGG